MREHGVDMWVVPMREYNEDPVFRAIVSPTTFAARRRTIYVFFDRGPTEASSASRSAAARRAGCTSAPRTRRSPPNGGDQAELWGAEPVAAARAASSRSAIPQAIAVNIAHEHNFADGLTAGEWEQMDEALGPDYAGRVVRRPRLAIDYPRHCALPEEEAGLPTDAGDSSDEMIAADVLQPR